MATSGGKPRIGVTAEQVAEKIRKGWSLTDIARHFKCSNDTVERRRHEAIKGGLISGSGVRKAPGRKPAFVENLIRTFTGNAPAQEPEVSDRTDPGTEQPETKINGKPWLLSKVVGNDLKSRYWYNKDADRYITVIRGVPEPVVTSGAEHRAICQAYSNYTGNSSTLNEMARDFQFPRAWLIQYLRIHGITHDKEPFSAEELVERETPDLVEDLYQMKRSAVHTALNEREWKETKKRAAKWDEFDHAVVEVIDDWASRYSPKHFPPVPSAFTPSGSQSSALILPMDFHYGKKGWEDEGKHAYTRQGCKDILRHHTEQILNRLVRFGRPKRIIVPAGSDWFHIDNPKGQTSAGTQQDMDGSPEAILSEGLEFKVEFLEMLRKEAALTLIPCYGNHDHHSNVALMKYLEAWFRFDAGVEIVKGLGSRNYYVSDSTLIGATHGNDINLNQLPILMANEQRDAWARTKHQLFVTGHVHHEQLMDVNGIMHYVSPSLSAADRWHEGRGYVLSRAAMAAVVLDEEEGPCEFIVSARQDKSTVGFKLKNHSRRAA